MKNLEMIKEDIKEIQKNFNPEKATYQVFDKLVNEDFSYEQMLGILSRVRGVDKFPLELKDDFFEIVNNLKILDEEEKKVKALNERKLREKLESQDHTRELKDIIDSLEKKEFKRELAKEKEEKVNEEVIEEPLDEKDNSEIQLEENNDNAIEVEEEKKDDNKFASLENDEESGEFEYEPKTIPQKLFIGLLVLVIITFIVMLLLFFFY